MAKRKKVRTDREIADTFEQNEDLIPQCIEYYNTPGFTVEQVEHPDNLWTILDRIHSDLMPEGEFDSNITTEQREWLQTWLEKWMDDIAPYCVRLESE